MAISFIRTEVIRQDPKMLWSNSENDKHYNFQKKSLWNWCFGRVEFGFDNISEFFNVKFKVFLVKSRIDETLFQKFFFLKLLAWTHGKQFWQPCQNVLAKTQKKFAPRSRKVIQKLWSFNIDFFHQSLPLEK